MKLFGNIVLALAGLIYLVPLQLLNFEARKPSRDGGIFWASLIVLVPLWLLLTLALMATTARGGLDWLGRERTTQYGLVIAAGIALMVVSGFSLVLKHETPGQVPWGVKPFLGWAVIVFPLVILMYCVFTLHPNLSGPLPVGLYRLAFLLVSAAALLASAVMCVELLVHLQNRQVRRFNNAIAANEQRDRQIQAEVEAMDTVKDFPRLLHFANRYEEPAIRELAIRKAQAHPEFTARIIEVLQGYYAEEALIYLDACDPPALAPLAEPVRTAILTLAEHAKESVERTHTMYAEQFDWDTRLILSVAEKFRDQGVDYLPAIRTFRSALNHRRPNQVELNAKRTLDEWLAKNAPKS